MDDAIVQSLQNFCDNLDNVTFLPDRLKLVNIPQLVELCYAVKPLNPLLVKVSYLQLIKNAPVVKFEARPYNSDDDTLSDVSVTCYGSLRETITIPSPDEFSDG